MTKVGLEEQVLRDAEDLRTQYIEQAFDSAREFKNHYARAKHNQEFYYWTDRVEVTAANAYFINTDIIKRDYAELFRVYISGTKSTWEQFKDHYDAEPEEIYKILTQD